MKFPPEVIKETKAIAEKNAGSDFIIGHRISPEEIEDLGIRIEDTLAIII